MRLNSTFNHVQLPSDQFVRKTLTDEGRDLLFTFGQRGGGVPEGAVLSANNRVSGHGGPGWCEHLRGPNGGRLLFDPATHCNAFERRVYVF
jgi:hypothetical protein